VAGHVDNLKESKIYAANKERRHAP
jgi:hypothetical protein